MPFIQNLREHIAAAFTGLWAQTHEPEEALRDIAALCRDSNWPLATWDVDKGLQVGGGASPAATDPVAAIKSVNSLVTNNGTAVLVLVHFHRFLQSTEVIQALAHQKAIIGSDGHVSLVEHSMDVAPKQESVRDTVLSSF